MKWEDKKTRAAKKPKVIEHRVKLRSFTFFMLMTTCIHSILIEWMIPRIKVSKVISVHNQLLIVRLELRCSKDNSARCSARTESSCGSALLKNRAIFEIGLHFKRHRLHTMLRCIDLKATLHSFRCSLPFWCSHFFMGTCEEEAQRLHRIDHYAMLHETLPWKAHNDFNKRALIKSTNW